MKKIYLEQIVEIRFKPQSKVLDKRGEITNTLVSTTLNQWHITNNSVELRNETNTRIKGFFGFKNMGFASNYPVAKSDFLKLSTEHIQKGWHMIPLNDVIRVGINTKILIPTDSFNNFFTAFKDKFFKLDDARIAGFGGTLVDIALPLNFSDGLNQFNTMFGPVQKSEFEKYFEKDSGEIPKYGIYSEVDYFTTEISTKLKQKDVLDLVQKGVEKAEKVSDYVFSVLSE